MDDWWQSGTDSLVVCSRSAVVEVAAILPATGRLVVARLNGTRMADADSTFYEFSDALFFPGYFGWNWNALSDCLRDLHWLAADGYLIAVENAPQLLSSRVEDRQTLFRILFRAAHHWMNPLSKPGSKGLPFKALLLCDLDEEATRLRREIASCGFGSPS